MKIPQINNISSFMNKKQWKDGNMMDIEEMTSEDFVKLVSNIGEIYLGNSEKITKVTGKVEIGPENYKLKTLILDNFEFVDTVYFCGKPEKPLNIGDHLFFKDCIFLKPLNFRHCNSSGKAVTDLLQQNEAIIIINGSFDSFEIDNCKFPFGVKMYSEEGEKLEIDYFKSENNIFINEGYDFENVTFKSRVRFISDKIENAGLYFLNCISSSAIRMDSIYSPSISFIGNDSNFQKDIRIWGGKLNSLVWNDGQFKGEIIISGVRVEEYLSLFGSTFDDKFQFRSNDENGQLINSTFPNEISIQDCSFNNGFELIGDKFKGNKLEINFSEKSSGVIDIQNTFFQEVTLKGNNFNNSVFLRGCLYDKLSFQHFFNKSQLSLSNNNPHLNNGTPKELKIEHSNLGNTEFYDFDFSIYPIVRVIDSRMDNIFAFGVEWFREKQLYVDEQETSPAKILSQKREIYRQLKFAAEKQSDRITSLFFKSRELSMHQQVLWKEKTKNVKGFLRRANISLTKYSDIASILFGYSNKHGRDWIIPLVLILVITTFSFYPLIFMAADPELSLCCLQCDFISPNTFGEKFWHYGSVWPSLFNPARRLGDLFPGTEVSFALGFWDGLQRIVLAFFIFQIVSAFRKFVK